jgi:hypothetical protein
MPRASFTGLTRIVHAQQRPQWRTRQDSTARLSGLVNHTPVLGEAKPSSAGFNNQGTRSPACRTLGSTPVGLRDLSDHIDQLSISVVANACDRWRGLWGAVDTGWGSGLSVVLDITPRACGVEVDVPCQTTRHCSTLADNRAGSSSSLNEDAVYK